MKIEKKIPSHVLSGTVALLSPYTPDISATSLVGALESFDTGNPDKPRLLTKHEVARRLGVSWYTIIRWAKAGDMPGAVKIGDQWRFKENELLQETAR